MTTTALGSFGFATDSSFSEDSLTIHLSTSSFARAYTTFRPLRVVESDGGNDRIRAFVGYASDPRPRSSGEPLPIITALKFERASEIIAGSGAAVGFELNLFSDDIVVRFAPCTGDESLLRDVKPHLMGTDDWRIDLELSPPTIGYDVLRDENDDESAEDRGRALRRATERQLLTAVHLWNASRNVA